MKKLTVVIMVVVMVFVSTAAMAQPRHYGGHHRGGDGVVTGLVILGTLVVIGAVAGVINAMTKSASKPDPILVQQPVPNQQPAYAQQENPEQLPAYAQQPTHAQYVVHETRDVLGKVEVFVGSPNGKGPAQIKGQKCFPNGAYFPNGGRLFNYNNQEVGFVPKGGTYEPGECLYD